MYESFCVGGYMKNALPISLNDLESIQQRLTVLESLVSSFSSAVGFPDYDNPVNINLTKNTNYTVVENGWFAIYCPPWSADAIVTVNDKVNVGYGRVMSGAYQCQQYTIFPVSKGDRVKISGSNLDSSKNQCMFMPCK